MIADRIGHGVAEPFGAGIVSAHQALKFGEFADHFGDEVRLAQACSQLGLGRVGLDHALLAQPARQLGHPLDLVGHGAKLFVEGDPLQLLRLVGQRCLAVLLPEEASVGQARGEHLAVASDDCRAAIGSRDIGGADEGIGKLARRILAHEVFLVGPRGELDHFGWHFEELLVKPAEQRHWPFGQPRVFDHEAFILDQREAGCSGGFASLGADQVLPLSMVGDDVGGAQLGGIVIRAIHADLAAGMEAVALGQAPGLDPADFAFNHLSAKQRDNGRERAHPAQAFRAERGGTPALRLGPGKSPHDCRDRFGQDISCGATGLFGDRKQHAVTLNQLVFAEAGLAQEAFKRLWRRADARALHFFADRRGCRGQAASDERKPAWCGPDGDRAHFDAGRVHFLAEQLFQIGARTGLHAGRNFFGAKFKQKVAHTVHPGEFASHSALFFSIQAWHDPLARSRTRPM